MRLKHCCAIGRNVQAPSPVVPDTGFPKISGKPLQKWWKSLLKSLLKWDDLGCKTHHFKETPMIAMQFFENFLWTLVWLCGLMCPWNSDILSLQKRHNLPKTNSKRPPENSAGKNPWPPKGSRIVANQALIFRGGTCPFQRGYCMFIEAIARLRFIEIDNNPFL